MKVILLQDVPGLGKRGEVKEAADPFSKTIGTLRIGRTVEVIDRSGEWYEIRIGDETGYVFAEFLQ